eukprot:evm.model.scf_1937.1 EVM.evm.TU.scf_1937.1   scf_1937:6756-9535(-)
MNPSSQALRGAADLLPSIPACGRAGRCGGHWPSRRAAAAEGGRDGRRIVSWRRVVARGAIGEGSDVEVAGVAAVAGAEAGEEELGTMEVSTISFTPTESDASDGTLSDIVEPEIEAEGDAPSVSSEPEGIDKYEAPYKIGDVVLGRTLWCNERGAKIELLDYPGHQ